MTTKNLIPRGSGEGGIGITGTSWGSGVFNTGFFDSVGIGTYSPTHHLQGTLKFNLHNLMLMTIPQPVVGWLGNLQMIFLLQNMASEQGTNL